MSEPTPSPETLDDTGAEGAVAPVDSGAGQVENQPAGGSRTYTKEKVDRTVKGCIDKESKKHRAELQP